MYMFLLLLAAVLVLLAAALIARPLLRARPALAPAAWTAFGCIAVLAVGSATLYGVLSSRSRHTSPAAGSPQAMVEQLVHKLQRQPSDLGGWLMLGRSYLVLHEYPLAVRAYAHAVRLSSDNAQALLGEAQALIMSNQTTLTGRAGDLIERALAHAPDDPEALFYGAVVALHRGELQVARERFQRVLALDPAPNVRTIVEQQLTAIDQELAPGSIAPTHTAPIVAAARNAVIRVRLELAPELSGRARPGAPLYVFVREPGEPGPPLAVERLSSHFPQTVVLRPQDSMMPGRAFTAGEQVEVIARIAPSGNPIDEPGDLSGQTRYHVGHEGLVDIRIDQVTR